MNKVKRRKMKIAVAGIGYVGLASAILLAQHNEVIAVDISQTRVDLINQRKPPWLTPKSKSIWPIRT